MELSDLALELSGEKHPLYALHDSLIENGIAITDLVRGNVNEQGLVFPDELLAEILLSAAKDARVYRPDPFGQVIARQAISQYYSGNKITPQQILLTPGTSISYWYCFKLLAEAGDEILCPLPSYPLLDYIARISDVNLRYYRLSESAAWAIDMKELELQITAKTRAIVLISPHNPTGMVASYDDLVALAELAAKYNLAIISDEVFAEFLFELDELPRPASMPAAPLVFTLNGFSKSFALSGLKLGWIAVSGDQALVGRAMSALEMISDTFLPVCELSQFACAGIFEHGKDFQKTYIDWVKKSRNIAVEILSATRFFPPPGGGFYLTVPLSPEADEDELALRILQNERILCHPGHFYEIEGSHLVLTFIHESSGLKDCLKRIATYL